jgi:hypothetical protein
MEAAADRSASLGISWELPVVVLGAVLVLLVLYFVLSPRHSGQQSFTPEDGASYSMSPMGGADYMTAMDGTVPIARRSVFESPSPRGGQRPSVIHGLSGESTNL